jgi:ATP-dependent RNA helicase DDX55/SPB4
MRKARRAEKKKLNLAWSHQVGRKEEKSLRKEKKDRKKKWLKTHEEHEGQGISEEPDLKRARAESQGETDNDWDELAREERMAKRVRRGEVTQRVFDQEFADL